MCAYEVAMDCLKDSDLPQSTRVVEGLREGLSLAESRQITPHIADRAERRAQSEVEVDGLLTCGALVRQMRESTERLLEVSHGLAVGRPRHGLLSRLPAVCQGLVPHFTPQGVVRQAFDLLGQSVGIENFHSVHDTGMQDPPPLLEQTAIG